ncbi:MAG: hypothetical protein EOQ95_04425 [Mesorhizobium sp.]|nr:MAG: hypothetical protein EOQ95_04425 [Mesorhizobium sp.]RWQ57164.1 MAG: hypothetical protein EOS84_06275 [Mesorhizobium sp.]
MGGVETNTIIKVAIGKRLGLLITFWMLACGSASALTLKEAMVGVPTDNRRSNGMARLVRSSRP